MDALSRRLGVGDAVVIGLGSMLGAGVFVVFAPAAAAAAAVAPACRSPWCWPASSGDIRTAIGFSACTVLVYYAITNAAALTLGPDRHRRLPVRLLAVLGLAGCLLLALSLPWASVLAGLGVLTCGAAWYALRHRAGAAEP